LTLKKEEKRLEAETRKKAKQKEVNQVVEKKESEEAPGLSLADLKAKRPVDFKGREIKLSKSNKKLEDGGEGGDFSKEILGLLDKEKDLPEGEDINI
jgi:hypothetical protein